MEKVDNVLGQILVKKQILPIEKVKEIASENTQGEKGFFDILQAKKLIPENKLAEAVAESLRLKYYNMDAFSYPTLPQNLDEKEIVTLRMLPIEEIHKDGKTILKVVTDYSTNQHFSLQHRISVKTANKVKLEIMIGAASKIHELIDLNYGQAAGEKISEDILIESIRKDYPVLPTAEQSFEQNDTDDNNMLIKYINQLLTEAYRSKASDLHFEPLEGDYRVRFRVDGVLRLKVHLPKDISTRFTNRLKVMSGMDISEQRKPQDGRMKYKVSEYKSIDFRVSSLPTLYGEKIVLRILDSSSAKLGIDSLGYETDQKNLFLSALKEPQGMILITGPTGSGKTISLYTGLSILNTLETNISTAEDPVEINLNGANQVQVNPKQGLTFADALRAFLRQDPDVIMVGEIRDLETAEISIKAAQTGHLVLSTLHTNNAVETITRLHNMGIPTLNLATSIKLVIAQRLARKLCPKCKQEAHYPEKTLLEIGFSKEQLDDPNFRIYKPVGCESCYQGYFGRVGIYEVVKITSELSSLIMENCNAIELSKAAREHGYLDLRQAGILKAIRGLTSVEEILHVTSESY